MSEREGGKKWLRCGCLGCLGLIVATLVLAGIMLAVVYLGSRPEQAEDRQITPSIPLPGPTGDPDAKPAVEPGENPAPATGNGEIVLDIRQAELELEAAPPGEPLSIQARYDRSLCELEENLDTESEPGWSYRLHFRCESGSFLQGVRQLLSGTKPRVLVLLPTDARLRLEVLASQGGAQMRLGGLWLNELVLDFEMGGVELGFDRPLKEPMERLEIHGAMGGLSAGLVGNASPRRLKVDYRMGGMELDLNGEWLQDAEIEIDFEMGGGAVVLPDGVRIEGIPDVRATKLDEAEIRPPTLRFSADSDMGELKIID
jgi:hypothetical protein